MYVLECSDGSLYCGITTDIVRRARQHNGEISGGAKYTAPRRPVKTVAVRECIDMSDALKHERRFKSLTRAQKLIEVERMNELRSSVV